MNTETRQSKSNPKTVRDRFTRGLTIVVALGLGACSAGVDFGNISLAPGTGNGCPLLGGSKPFAFNPSSVVGASTNTMYLSNEVRIECGSDLLVTVSWGEYSIDGGAFTSADGTISDGQRLRVRIRSAPTFGTDTQVTVQVGKAGLPTSFVMRHFRVTTVPGDPANAPTVTILSPQDNVSVNASRISVTGQANDPDGISEIRVNGVPATTSDGYATWEALVPLTSGTNTLTVRAVDSLGNANPVAGEITIQNLAVVLLEPVDLEVDDAGSRLLVLDRTLLALVAIDFATGAYMTVSDDGMPDGTVPFVDPDRIAVNAANDTAWVIDHGYDDLIVVDLATGSRSLLSDSTGSGNSPSLTDAQQIVLDAISNQALLLMVDLVPSPSVTSIVAVDLATGARRTLSDATTPNTDNPLGSIMGGKTMVFDPIGFRLIVTQWDNVLGIDPITGQRDVFSSARIHHARDAAMDLPGNRILVHDGNNNRLDVVDLNSGDVQSIWPFLSGDSPERFALDTVNNRLLVLYSVSEDIHALDMLTGEWSIPY